MKAIACLSVVAAWLSAGQALPPPLDGEIRALYSQIQGQTEVWLTLEPRSADGKPAPPGTILTFTSRFAGRRPPTPPERVDLRAYAGLLWAPRAELWLLLDDRDKLELVPPGAFALATGSVSDHLQATIPISAFSRITKAERINGTALGFEFELTEGQRQALRLFLERVLSENPAGTDKQLSPNFDGNPGGL